MLYGQITITKIIADEFGYELPEYINIENTSNITYQKILESYVDIGEASALALAICKTLSNLIRLNQTLSNLIKQTFETIRTFFIISS